MTTIKHGRGRKGAGKLFFTIFLSLAKQHDVAEKYVDSGFITFAFICLCDIGRRFMGFLRQFLGNCAIFGAKYSTDLISTHDEF